MKTQKIFSKEMIKDWSLYEQQLKNYPTVSQMFGSILEKWVSALDNPFSILWFRQLFENKLDYLDNLLTSLHEKNTSIINDKIVKELINEKSIKEENLIDKVVSLNGELLTYKYLTDKFSKVEPLESYGDFVCNDAIIVSVKSKTIADYNCFLIGEYIHGLLYLKDYALLKNYEFFIEEIDGISYSFRKRILKFIKNDFVKLINGLPEPMNEYDYKSLIKCYNYDGPLTVTADKFICNNQKKMEFILTYQNKTLKMKLQYKLDDRINNINGVKVYYPDEEKYILANIESSIDDWLTEFDSKSQKDNQKTFWGWINIPVTYLHENGFLADKEKVKKELEQKYIKKTTKLFFVFIRMSALK